jgi:dipeptidyl aminopeptidase/acylaminoacyl peptidase
LTLPANSTPPYSAVVLITGSSKQDRDHVGSPEEPVSRYKPFRQIADALSRRNIAVLRMDDQGVGCSGGRQLEDVTIEERADDTLAGVAFLRGRPDINPDRIGLLGLSEGGNIGPMIAASDSSIQALVIMAGSATNGLKIREYQVRGRLADRTDLSEAQKEKALQDYMAGVRSAVARGEGTRHVRSFFDYMPLPTAGEVTCPTLIIHCERDANVPVDHAHLLAKAMAAAGNRDVEVKIFKDHNHLFLPDADGRISGYAELLEHTNRLPDSILETISGFLTNQLLQPE